LEEAAASVFRERCPEEGYEQLFVNFDNHKPKHTASHPKDHIFRYFDVSSCKVNVIHEVETVQSLCCHLLRENRKEHEVTSLLRTHGKRRPALCLTRCEIIRVVHITPINNRGKSGTLHVTLGGGGGGRGLGCIGNIFVYNS
jgi:hypothetical protein